jgi:hypothetical protein
VTRYRFHTTVHAKPPQVAPGNDITIDGIVVHTLDVKPMMLANSLRVSFEEAAAQLQKFPRMFVEPDGAFVWVSAQDNATANWQVEGVLCDRGGRLMFVDLKGECTDEALQQLLSVLGSPKSPLMFQLVRQAVFLDECEFRRCSTVETS